MPYNDFPKDSAFHVSPNGVFYPWSAREWLLTNGMGSFAHGTVVGCNTRRYHGLLIAATLPPVGRMNLLSRVAETITLDGDRSQLFELSVNQFRDALHPRGDQYLREFRLWHTARWDFVVDGVAITKELLLCWKKNVIGIRYMVDAKKARKVRLEVAPFTPLRDFHHTRHRGGTNFNVSVEGTANEARVAVSDVGTNGVLLQSTGGWYESAPDWWYGHFFPIENDRGLDDNEDLFTPGRFINETADGKLQLTVWASSLSDDALPDWDAELARIKASRGDWSLPGGAMTSPTVRRLIRAASDLSSVGLNPVATLARPLSPGTPGSPTGAATPSSRCPGCS